MAQRVKVVRRGRVRCKRGQWVKKTGRYYTCHSSREAAGRSTLLDDYAYGSASTFIYKV